MRYDDRLTTALRIGTDSEVARARLWRQLIDLLAQDGHLLSPTAAARAMAALSLLRDAIPLGVRIDAARTVAARCAFLPLLSFHAADASPVVRAMFGTVRLPDEAWQFLLPDLGPVARSVLRHRADLSPATQRALASFGSTDFTLPATAGAHQADTAPPRIEIRDLVRRIEEYRSRKGDPTPDFPVVRSDVSAIAEKMRADQAGVAIPPFAAGDPLLVPTTADLLPMVAFETDIDGVVCAVSGPERGRFVGITLAEPALVGEPGCDAGVARAFSKRGAIRSGRVMTADAATFESIWLLNAMPRFDPATGRFDGYFGTIRRAEAGELASDSRAGAANASDLPAGTHDGVRQLVHELRSPLNAIQGFAQLIEGQYFGPVSRAYRDLSAAIIIDAHALRQTISEIDSFARLDGNSASGGNAASGGRAATNGDARADLAEALAATLADFAPLLAVHGNSVELVAPAPLTEVAVSGDRLRAIADALLRTLLPGLSPGEGLTVTVTASPAIGLARIVLALPTALSNVPVADMGEHAYLRGNDGGVAVGLGLSVQIVQALTSAAGGDMCIDNGQWFINLPLAIPAAQRVDAIG